MSEKVTTQLVVRIDPKLHRQFRHAAIDHGTSMREIVENAIDAYLRSRRGVTNAAVAERAEP